MKVLELKASCTETFTPERSLKLGSARPVVAASRRPRIFNWNAGRFRPPFPPPLPPLRPLCCN